MISEREDANVFPLEDLPDGVLNKLVQEHLAPLEYIRFRCVSKRCRSVAPLKPWLIIPSCTVETTTPIKPFTFYFRNFFAADPTVVGKHKRCASKVGDDPLLAYRNDKCIAFWGCSRRGWFLMSSYNFRPYQDIDTRMLNSVFMYNPITTDVFPLAKIVADYFYFLPSLRSSEVVVCGGTVSNSKMMEMIRPGIVNEWKDLQPQEYYSLIDAFGRFSNVHVLTNFEDEFDFVKRIGGSHDNYDSLIEVRVKTPLHMKPCDQKYFVACDGYKLLAVHVGEAGKWIKVFKLNESDTEWEWEEVKDLGNNCLYLSKISSFAMNYENENYTQMKNRIYFDRCHGNGSVIYYSMKTCKLHYLSLSEEGRIVKETLNDFSELKELHHSSWFEPRLRPEPQPNDHVCVIHYIYNKQVAILGQLLKNDLQSQSG